MRTTLPKWLQTGTLAGLLLATGCASVAREPATQGDTPMNRQLAGRDYDLRPIFADDFATTDH